MKIQGVIFLFMLFIAMEGYSSGELHIAGARAIAMGGSSVTIGDIWSLYNNPSGTAFLDGLTAGITFRNLYLVKEASNVQFGLALPMKAGSFGIIVSRFGSSDYNEIRAGLSFAKKFGKHFSAGVLLDYYRFNLQEHYGSKNLISFEVGMLFRANRNISVGFHLVNPVPVKTLNQPEEWLPTIVRIGISYEFSAAFLVCLEAEKELSDRPVIRVGAEYRLAKCAFVRIGMATTPMLFSFGFGLKLSGFILDFATDYHSVLGFSPVGTLIWSIKK